MTKTLALVQSGVAAGGHSSSKHPGVFIPADRRRGAAAATTQKPHLVTWHQESQPHPTRQDMPGPVAEAEGLVFPYQSHRVSQGVTARRTRCSGPTGVLTQHGRTGQGLWLRPKALCFPTRVTGCHRVSQPEGHCARGPQVSTGRTQNRPRTGSRSAPARVSRIRIVTLGLGMCTLMTHHQQQPPG